MAKKFVDYRTESRSNWGAYMEDGEKLNREQLNTGAVLRIADATEKMASNYTALQNDRNMYKRWYNNECESVRRLRRQNAALRGQITKLKKRPPDQ